MLVHRGLDGESPDRPHSGGLMCGERVATARVEILGDVCDGRPIEDEYTDRLSPRHLDQLELSRILFVVVFTWKIAL